jgi:hypothetical protein
VIRIPAESVHTGNQRRDDHLRLGDTWEWDGTTWTQVAFGQTAPSARHAHAMAPEPVNGGALLFGGTAGSGETWWWDGSAWQQLAPAAAPTARSHHALATDPFRSRIVLFGGTTTMPNGPTGFHGNPYLQWVFAARR